MSETLPPVALVEDDEDLRHSTAQLLKLAGFAVTPFDHAVPALVAIDADWEGVVVCDVRMPHVSGLEAFAQWMARDPQLPVILITGHGDVPMAVEALKSGAWDFLAKPFDPQALVAAVKRAATARALVMENRRLRAALEDGEAAGGLIGQSPEIQRLRQMVGVLGDADIDIFIEGESGTGKEHLARMIHRAGRRGRQRLVSVACAGMPPALEEQLFAPIGQHSVMAAHRGTLLLDDIDLAPRSLQARLVPVVEERVLRAAAMRDAAPLDLRVIATGGAQGALDEGAMLPSLFYRLSGLRLRLPPLRERVEDIPLLFAHFVEQAASRRRVTPPALTAPVQNRLRTHHWPGNLRELAHYAESFVLGLAEDRAARPAPSNLTLPERLDAFEREAILDAIAAQGGEIGAAIAQLGIPRKTFYYKVGKLGIDLRRVKDGLKQG